MDVVLMAVLILALGGALVSFLVMGFRDTLRARAFRRQAQNHSILFSRDDPFDVPRFYGRFKLMQCGHSPRACNVSHGQIAHHAVRLLDYRYEVAHGTLRSTRRYHVLVIEVPDAPSGEALLWDRQDIDSAPLEVRRIAPHAERFAALGDLEWIERLAAAVTGRSDDTVNVELRDGLLMLFMPMKTASAFDYHGWLQFGLETAETLTDRYRSRKPDSNIDN